MNEPSRAPIDELRILHAIFLQPDRFSLLQARVPDSRLFEQRTSRILWQALEILASKDLPLDGAGVRAVLTSYGHDALLADLDQLLARAPAECNGWEADLALRIEEHRREALREISQWLQDDIDRLLSIEILSRLNDSLGRLNRAALDVVTFASCPARSPRAVSEAIRDVIADKVVCDLGCGEGDNLMFLKRYAKRVIGLNSPSGRPGEIMQIGIAISRGFDIVISDYNTDPLPAADVYYYWPQNGDYEKLVRRFLKEPALTGILVLPGDSGYPAETKEVTRIVHEHGGELRCVPYCEGQGYRQSGIVTVAILDMTRT